MRKHYKLISGIACIVLCIAIISFGVYAASTSLVHLSSTVSFTPSTAQLKIFGGIAGSKEATPSSYYATNYGEQKDWKNATESGDVATFATWNYDTATFDDNYIETSSKTHPDPIYFFIQITNYVERNVKYTVDITSDYSGKNLNVSCLYAKTLNSEVSTTSMYNITGTSEPSQTTTNNLVANGLYTTFLSNASYKADSVEFDLSTIENSTFDTSLSTVMIVIKLEVDDNETSIDSETAFNFTVSMV